MGRGSGRRERGGLQQAVVFHPEKRRDCGDGGGGDGGGGGGMIHFQRLRRAPASAGD